MAHEVFISHSSIDKFIADFVCTTLEQNKIKCWIAPRDVTQNKNYGSCVAEAIKLSKVVIMILSKNSETSMSVANELNLANQYEVKIIPVISDELFPNGCNSLNFKMPIEAGIDLVNPLSIRMNKLVAEIRSYITLSNHISTGFDENHDPGDTDFLTKKDQNEVIADFVTKREEIIENEIISEALIPQQLIQTEEIKLMENNASFVFVSANSKDYDIARKVYFYLVENNVNTFFADETLKQLGNADYRNQIDKFLDICDHMIVVTSSSEHVKSSWVEAEWGFFVNEKRSGRKHGNIITITYGTVEISKLPPSLRYYEVMNFSDAWTDRLLQYIK